MTTCYRIRCEVIVKNLPIEIHNFLNYKAGDVDSEDVSEEFEEELFDKCDNIGHDLFETGNWSSVFFSDYRFRYKRTPFLGARPGFV